MKNVKIFTGQGSTDLAKKIVKSYFKHSEPIKLGKKAYTEFSDGEFKSFPDESVRDCYVFIVQSTFAPSDNFWELLMLIDAAKRASAYKVIAVIPYFGYARQDRKSEARAPITARLAADMIEAAGADRVITIDLHADQEQGFFKIPVDHLFAASLFVPLIKKMQLSNLAIAAPDMGASKRAIAYQGFLRDLDVDANSIICYKSRSGDNKVGDVIVLGDAEDKNIVIVDDMIDTAGTITAVAKALKEAGAKSVRAMATHPVLSGSAHKRILNSCFDRIILTDTIPLRQKNDRIEIVSVADHFAEVISNVVKGDSISSSFIQKSC